MLVVEPLTSVSSSGARDVVRSEGWSGALCFLGVGVGVPWSAVVSAAAAVVWVGRVMPPADLSTWYLAPWVR